MGWFDDVSNEVQGWFGGGDGNQNGGGADKQPAQQKDPGAEIEVQRAQQDVQAAQMMLDNSKKALDQAENAFKQAQDAANQATQKRDGAEGDGGSKVPGSSANKAWLQAKKAEDAAKAKLATATKTRDRCKGEVAEREGDLRQMKYRLDQAQKKAAGQAH